MESDGSEQSDDVPTVEVISVNGEPLWRVSFGGIAVEERCGHRAMEKLLAICASRGVAMPPF